MGRDLAARAATLNRWIARRDELRRALGQVTPAHSANYVRELKRELAYVESKIFRLEARVR